jgi:signal transduction histidine kinase
MNAAVYLGMTDTGRNSDAASVERALRESEERYRAFIANSAEGIWRVELDRPIPVDMPVDEQVELLFDLGVIAECNDAGARMYGFEHGDEIVGARLDEFLLRTEPANHEYLRAFVASGYRMADAESAEEDREGRRKYFVNNLVGVVEDSMLLRAWGTQRDITERKRVEAERDELLAREREAREEAQRASRLKDEFLATVSHELRTPLTAVLGWARLLRLGGFDAERQAAAIETIERNARAQAQLIEDLLDVSRIVTGKLSPQLDRVEAASFVCSAIESVRPTAEAKQLTLAATIAPGTIAVLGDAGRLEQVVWNLLSNAIKFTPDGGRIDVRLGLVDGEVEVAVRDTGVGISHEFLPHVFERFRQADATISREHSGLGLGLAIVQHVVELHRGRVRAESEGIGCGATFVVRLPAASSELAASADEAGRDAWRLDGIRVLVVDDSEDAREMLSVALARSGAEVATAASTAEALAALAARRPDVVVADLAMAGEDGFALARRLRALPPELGGATPAIAVTAYVLTDDRVRVLEAGFQSLVTKPLVPERIVEAVAGLVGRA